MEKETKSEGVNEVHTELSISQHVTENPDSITIGSATKGSQLKIYGDFSRPEEFKKKIDAAKEIRDYAQANISVNI